MLEYGIGGLGRIIVYSADEYSELFDAKEKIKTGYVIRTIQDGVKKRYVSYFYRDAKDIDEAVVDFKNRKDLEDWTKEILRLYEIFP